MSARPPPLPLGPNGWPLVCSNCLCDRRHSEMHVFTTRSRRQKQFAWLTLTGKLRPLLFWGSDCFCGVISSYSPNYL